MTSLKVFRITTVQEMGEALDVRRAVFVQEQNVPIEIEIDEHDGDPGSVSSALHVLGRSGGGAVATGRLLLDPEDSESADVGHRAAEVSQKEAEVSQRRPMSAASPCWRPTGATAGAASSWKPCRRSLESKAIPAFYCQLSCTPWRFTNTWATRLTATCFWRPALSIAR